MPRIFDNIVPPTLLTALRETLATAHSADYCVGYFNLRGWKDVDDLVGRWPGGIGNQCRLLIGMQTAADDELRRLFTLAVEDNQIDQAEAIILKRKIAEGFRQQLTFGAPTNADETALRRLSNQLRSGNLVVRLFLRHTLHAKLYLNHRDDANLPIVAFLGSSNLTMAGLSKQGELNVDVLDHDACLKLQEWFDKQWSDRFCLDITTELADIIDASWARDATIPPFHIYLKMAYHLSREAQAGIAEFQIPRDFRDTLFPFQAKAVQIAAIHLNKRGGVLIGDVVGLGKTLMASALAKVFQEDQHTETLILCPKNLVKMWRDYVDRYRLVARVIAITSVDGELQHLARFRVVLIDESHNLRNREGKRYQLIAEYIEKNDSKVILLSATPYNKAYDDLGAQLALFVGPEEHLGTRPEAVIREVGGEVEFVRRHQCGLDTLAAFQKSTHADDWRELMRLYMVRRTRSFIQDVYAEDDLDSGRKYLTFPDGSRSYFPRREPRTLAFGPVHAEDADPYALLYSPPVIDAIDQLFLPRYGLGNYLRRGSGSAATRAESDVMDDLGRAGQRLLGFCRTNLFKRLESGGPAFLQSLERHALRNFVYAYAIAEALPLPIGPQDAAFLDDARFDEDADAVTPDLSALEASDDDGLDAPDEGASVSRTELDYRKRAMEVYRSYQGPFSRRFKWIRPAFFYTEQLSHDLLADARALLDILRRFGQWDPGQDHKLRRLKKLLQEDHPNEKVLVFSQFADTVRYLETQLQSAGVKSLKAVTGRDADPTEIAWRFSPVSNDKRDRVRPEDELRVVLATDVLSEGQNLQDCGIVVNFDLPWAIIRLIQRAGRVDRIGQKAAVIPCYSFLPADGVERIIDLRARVQRRLHENAEVVGSDEAFFEDQLREPVLNIYNETAGIFDGDVDSEVDLASEALAVWDAALKADPSLKHTIEALPNVVYSARQNDTRPTGPAGVLLYLQTAHGNDSLAWVDERGDVASQSTLAVFRAAQCEAETPAVRRSERHHELVQSGVEHLLDQEKAVGGQLGRPSGARFKTYERLKRVADAYRGTLFATPGLERAIEEIYRFPLLQSATDTLNRQLRAGIDDRQLAELVVKLRDDGRLCNVQEAEGQAEAYIVCSLGLVATMAGG